MSAIEKSPFNWPNRLTALVLFVPCAVVLCVAAWLTPDGAGHGTHTQLGLSACGFVERTGMPCATCGMTTSFAHAADGNLIGAFVTQPAGATLAVIMAMVGLVSGYAMVTGVSLLPAFQLAWRPRVIVLFGVLVMGAWLYKIVTFEGYFG